MTACESATKRRVLLAAIAQQVTLPENPPDCRATRFASLPAGWSAGVRQGGRQLGSFVACSSLSACCGVTAYKGVLGDAGSHCIPRNAMCSKHDEHCLQSCARVQKGLKA